MTTIVAAAGGGNWTSGGTWVGGVAPTASDDVQLSASSGNVTVNSGAVCRSLDCTSYTGTLTHTSGVTLTIGDATAGSSNIALKLVSGMTYTLGSATTSAISFISTSATVQTIDTGGKTLGNWTVNGAGSSYQLTSSVNTGNSAAVTLTAGALDVNGQTCSWGSFASSNSNVRSLTLGAASITLNSASGWSLATPTNLTFSAGTSTITFAAGSGATLNLGSNLNYNNVVFSLAGSCTVTSSGGQGTGVIANLTRTGTAAKTDNLQIATSLVVSGTLTLTGNSVTNRLLLSSNAYGVTRVVTVNGSIVASNIDIANISGIGSASWNLASATGGAGDAGGCTGITFTTSATQAWQGTSGGNWSDVTKWTSRVPLPQDDVTISVAFTAAQTVTMDMARLGRSIDWTGATGSPVWAITSTPPEVFGSLTLVAGMTITGTASAFTLRGTGSRTVTTNGVSFPGQISLNAGTGAYTLQDALTTAGVIVVGVSPHKAGTLNTNGMTVTCATLTVGNTQGGSVLTLGSSTINLTSTAAIAIITATVTSGNAINAGTSTIVVVNASANDRTIAAHGFTLATVTYTVSGSTGRLIFGVSGATGTVTVGTLNFSDASNARGLRVWAGTVLAITTLFNVVGSSGKLVTIDTSTSGTRATLSKASGVVSTDYLSVVDTAAGGGTSWYAGTHSTDAGNNTGWVFTAPPPIVTAGSFFAFI